MKELSGRTRRAVLLRSFSVQGSWNYETLIGTGFAFTLLPALRHAYDGDEEGLSEAVRRHAEVFNSHPYLATVAAGAVSRLEADRVDPRVIERFKSALRGSLGSLGDQLVWLAWRPASMLLALALALAGAGWGLAVAAFLLVYNALHFALRVWGFRTGLAAGLEVGKAVRSAPLQELGRRAADAGAVLAGVAVVLALAPAMADADWTRLGIGVGGAGVGLWLGLRARRVADAVVGAVWALAIILGLIS